MVVTMVVTIPGQTMGADEKNVPWYNYSKTFILMTQLSLDGEVLVDSMNILSMFNFTRWLSLKGQTFLDLFLIFKSYNTNLIMFSKLSLNSLATF